MPTFDDWKTNYESYSIRCGVEERMVRRARLSNLLGEDRIPVEHGRFVQMLVNEFTAALNGGETAESAASSALERAVRELRMASGMHFLLASKSSFHTLMTYATSEDIAQLGGLGDIDPDDPPPVVPNPDRQLFACSRKAVLWFTPDDLPDDPDVIARDLGLPHFEGHLMFRFSIDAISIRTYVPTCLDAGLYEAWQRGFPHEVNAFGRARHVETGDRTCREVVVPTRDVQGMVGDGERVPAGTALLRVTPMNPDYLTGR